MLLQEAYKIAAEFPWIESHAEVLHTQDAALVDDRGKKGVIYAAVRVLGREHAIAARHLADGVGRSREEGPAGKIGAERLRVLFEHLRGIALGINRDGDEGDLLAEILA